MADSDLTRSDGTRLRVGDRISNDGSLGTVRYIGEVPPTKGIWLGVDWDDADRGKHDGMHEGKRYFEARHPKSGSFIRPKKAELGVACFAALRDRYGLIDEDNAGVKPEELYVIGGNSQTTVVEMVGAKKVNLQQSKLEKLKEIGLRGLAVYGNGPVDSLRQFTPSITDLNLSKNLLPSWEEVARITEQLPHLQILNVSDNCLVIPDKTDSLQSSFQNVKHLFMNRMQYNWEQILTCSEMFPRLEQLHVCYNKLTSLTVPGDKHLQHVNLLNLDSNQLNTWTNVLKVSMLPRLETLIVSENNLETIEFSDVHHQDKTKHFKNLQTLTMMNNKINDWVSVNELNKLENLTALKFQGNTIWQGKDDSSVRQQIVARIKTLTVCNSSKITKNERQGAENDYLKSFGNEWKEAGGNQDPAKNNPSQAFLDAHPRYMQMVQRWGAPEDSELIVKSSALKDSLLSVFLSCPQLPDRQPVKKKLPLSMTVQKVKTLVQRLFHVETGDIILSYQSQKMEGPEIQIDNDLRQISFYSVENDDTIIVKWE